MNWLQRFAVRLAARIAPPLGSLLRNSGGTVDRLAETVQLYRDREQAMREERQSIAAEWKEALALTNGGPWLGGVREADAGGSKAVTVLKERLAELELALEDRGWKRQLAMAETEFSRYGIQQIILISRLYFLKNPLIRRGVKVSAMYVFGRGVEVTSEDTAANKVIQAFLDNPQNQVEWSHSGLVQKEEGLYTDGNLFLAFFTSPDDGSTVVRTIDSIEIEEVISDPDDASIPWFYHRRWTHYEFDPKSGVQTPQPKDSWYVAVDYTPPTGLNAVKGQPLMKDKTGQLIPILHVKVGALPKWHFGCPLVYAALDWARAYRHFLEDWCTITRALARFAWQVETQGGAPAIAAFKQTLATTLGYDGSSVETNPPPVVGSAFVSGPGNKLTPVKTTNSTSDPEQGRRVLLMVASAFGLPETFFGDASTGSLATAQSLDRPTELQFMQRQEAWRETLQRICRYVLQQSATAPGGKLKEAQKQAKNITIKVDFPSVLEHDLGAAITAIVTAATLNGFEVSGIDEKVAVGLLLKELGVEDTEKVLEAMYPEGEYDPDRTVEDEPPPPAVAGAPAPGQPPAAGAAQPAQTQNPAQQQGAPPQGPKPKTPKPKRNVKASDQTILAAVHQLKEAVRKLNEKK